MFTQVKPFPSILKYHYAHVRSLKLLTPVAKIRGHRLLQHSTLTLINLPVELLLLCVKQHEWSWSDLQHLFRANGERLAYLIKDEIKTNVNYC